MTMVSSTRRLILVGILYSQLLCGIISYKLPQVQAKAQVQAQSTGLLKQAKKAFIAAATVIITTNLGDINPSFLSTLSSSSLSSSAFVSSVANAADQEWTERQQLAAETWKQVDEGFYDRTFNGQDWFKLRQSVVKRKYSSDEEVYEALKDMLGKLGDQYTRYLTPIQYSTLLNSAKGELTGVGLELLSKENGDVQVSINE